MIGWSIDSVWTLIPFEQNALSFCMDQIASKMIGWLIDYWTYEAQKNLHTTSAWSQGINTHD
jgi:hypothetical protein